MNKTVITLLCLCALLCSVRSVHSQQDALRDSPFTLKENVTSVEIDGNYMKAFSVAYADYKALKYPTDSKKQLGNYKVYFTENNEYIVVRFSPKDDGQNYAGGGNSLGYEIQYKLKKPSMKIVKKGFSM